MWKRSTCFAFLIVSLALIQGGVAYAAFNANTDPSLVGFWNLDEGSGTVAADSSPNQNDGTFNGDPQWVEGWLGGAVLFDGSDDYIDTGWTENLATWTVSAWVTSPAAPAGNSPSGPVHRESNYQINWDHTDTVYQGAVAINAGGWNAAKYGPVEADTWYFIVGTYDGEELKAYRNGELITTNSTPSGAPAAEGNSLKFGRHAAAAQYFNGTVDDVRVYNRALTADEILVVMQGGEKPELASTPNPADEETDVPRDEVMSWTAGAYAATHDVYFGTNYEDVNAASRSDAMGVLVSQGQAETSYDPGRLEFAQTYYWRVDEVNAAPDNTIFKGDIWSFEVEPFAYAVPNVIATSNGDSATDPQNAVNGSGLNADDQHSVEADDMWVTNPPLDGAPLYVQFEFDSVYKLAEAQVWNYNVQFEKMLGFGLKNVTVEYSTDGVEWTTLGDFDLEQATAKATYVYNSTIDFQGAPVKYVRLTVNSGFGMLGQYGLSEIRFMYTPVQARQPQPADGATDVATDPMLSWRAGREAASHEVYLDTDPNATSLLGTTTQTSLAAGTLDLATTYYWKVVEVNDAEAVTAWEGPVWSFTTRPFTMIEDFESYTDDIEAGEAIFDTWLDGWVNDTGSTVGHMISPFAEQDIVHSGGQSMPLFYDNSGGISTAEATRTFDSAQDWTASNAKTLAVYFHGAEGNTGQLYLKINDTEVPYDGEASDIALAQWQAWLVDLTAVGGNLQSVREITVGIEGAGASGVVYIDDIRLYPDEIELIEPVQPDAAGMILHYAFDEGSGTSAADASGNGNTGIINGNPAWVTGVSGTALSFDGSRDYVTADKSLLNDLPQFTIACWLKGDLSLGNRSGLIGQNDCVEYGVVSANTIQIYTAGGGTVDLPWAYSAQADWHHVVAVGDGIGITFYVDGKAAVSGGTETESYGTSTYALNVGGGGIFDAADNWFSGQIDEIYVYQRALSAAEIAGLAGRTVAVPEPF